MDGSRSAPSKPDQLGALKPSFRLAEEEAEYTLLDRSEERRRNRARCTPRDGPSHFGNDRTRYGNGCARLRDLYSDVAPRLREPLGGFESEGPLAPRE